MRTTLITISSFETNKFFFTDNHCQDHGLGETYVPCTYTLPITVVPRPCLPNGIVKTKEDLISIFYTDMQQIPNPYQMSLKEYVLYLHSMTTSEFCKEHKLPAPVFTGDIKTSATAFIQIDAIKNRLITEYAKNHD
jgi:hypothetical protein